MKTIHQKVSACLDASTQFYFVILEKDGRINYVNPFFQKQFEHILSNYSGASFFKEGFSVTENLNEKINDLLAQASSQKFVQQIPDKDGGISYISWEMTLSYSNDNQKEFIQCIGVAITGNYKSENEPETSLIDYTKPKAKLADQMMMASENFYLNLVANSLDGMLILDKEGLIQFVSPSVESILGFTRDDLMLKSGFNYIHPEDYQVSIDSFNQELNEQPIMKSILVRLLHKSGQWIWCLLRGHNLVDNPAVNGMVIYFYDDSLRKQAREILKESESRFRNLITDLQSGVMLLNNKMEITLCNKAGLQLLGYKDEPSLVGKTTSDVDWDIIGENNLPLEFSGRPSFMAFNTREMVKNVVMGIKKQKQSLRTWVLVNAVPIFDNEGEILHVITSFSDITERRKLEHKLRKEEITKHKQLTQATIDGQEKERKEIGKELHDNVGQQLTTTKLFLEIARSTANENTLEMITMAIKSVSDAINEVRSLSRSLVPPTLGDLGLVDSVRELCYSLKRSQAFQIRFYHKDFIEDKIQVNQALMLYRVIQEQVNNIIKHSEARAVILKLKTDEGGTKLEIIDNGKGFDLNHYKKGLGFINMTNRVELFNGTLEVFTEMDKGCHIKVQIPCIDPAMILN